MKRKLKTTAAQTQTKKEVEDPVHIKQEQTEVSDRYDPQSIFVTNLKWDITESHLAAHFGSVGDISKVTVLRDKMTGFSRGSAYLQFYQAKSVGPALGLTNTYIRDSFIIVQRKKNPQTSNQQVGITENNNIEIKPEVNFIVFFYELLLTFFILFFPRPARLKMNSTASMLAIWTGRLIKTHSRTFSRTQGTSSD